MSVTQRYSITDYTCGHFATINAFWRNSVVTGSHVMVCKFH